jgi:hypothetical protein
VSGLSLILAVGLLAFVFVASGVLLWEGLAEAGHGHAAVHRGLRHARARLVVGAIGFALALWIAIGLLSRAR